MAEKVRKRKAGKPRPKAAPESPEDRSLANRLLSILDQREEQLALINGVLRTIVGGATLPQILKVFAGNLKTLCPFDRCSISIYDEKARVFNVPYMIFEGHVQETNDAPRPFGSTILSKVIETRQPLLRRNLVVEEKEKRYEHDTDFVKRGFSSELIFPLTVANRAFGTFNIASFEADRLTEKHIYLIQDLIPAVSIAVWQHLEDVSRKA
jgi:transcriptional regulator with GAF, ATPase, and Fis domain